MSVLFRNKEVISGIETGALWKLEGARLVLVDDDQYVTVDYESHKTMFENENNSDNSKQESKS
jgi:hypothetical protein